MNIERFDSICDRLFRLSGLVAIWLAIITIMLMAGFQIEMWLRRV